MSRELFHFLGAWLLATLFIFLGCAVIIAVLIVGAMFITWSLPDIRPWAESFFGIRVLFAFSVFMGFCWAASPDWDDPF
ncbi:cell division protein FtsK [Escherichia coli]|uniref:cell division protein FtsK n=1 Tax=Escherichia coli TaxID=562 RepID=UPI000992F6A7|nr:cell division protein FtsK [Escherichia coli]AQW17617.1 cell division protein FtsK [Escherichia coli]HDZ7376651.1 cell division protein FtsK [Escherichia coli]